MFTVGVHEAKTTFSALLRRVAAGEEVVITRGTQAVPRLVPVRTGTERLLGRDGDVFEVPDDFDAPLTDDVLDCFNG